MCSRFFFKKKTLFRIFFKKSNGKIKRKIPEKGQHFWREICRSARVKKKENLFRFFLKKVMVKLQGKHRRKVISAEKWCDKGGEKPWKRHQKYENRQRKKEKLRVRSARKILVGVGGVACAASCNEPVFPSAPFVSTSKNHLFVEPDGATPASSLPSGNNSLLGAGSRSAVRPVDGKGSSDEGSPA